MRLVRCVPEHPRQASRDEELAAQITAHFTIGAPWPDNEAHIARHGHTAPAPSPYGEPWPLEDAEHWLSHGLGTYFYGLEARGDFSRAGAAAILVTTHGLRLLLGSGGPERPRGWLLASRSDRHAPSSRLEPYRFRFIELREIGAGDLMLLRFWKLEPLVLRVPWPRSTAALISGLRMLERQPRALENDVVNLPGPKTALEVKASDSSAPRDIVVSAKRTS